MRPHELTYIRRRFARADGIVSHVRRVTVGGASVRVELKGEVGPLEAELERDAWHALGLREGDGVTRARTWRAFALPQ